MNYLDKNGLSYFWEKIKNALAKKQDKLTAGDNITIENNVISAAGGGTGGTSDYDSLTNRPKINNVTLTGNKTLDDLGIQEKGNFVPTNSASANGKLDLFYYDTDENKLAAYRSGYFPSTPFYIPTMADVESKQDKLSIITATLTADKSITGTATTNDIALIPYKKVGTRLGFLGGNVVIESGVSNVLVSGSVRITNDATSGSVAYNCYIYKNGEIVASSRMYGIGNGATGACSTPIVLVPVQQGDIIKLAIWKASSNKCTVSSAGNATLLTVQAL